MAVKLKAGQVWMHEDFVGHRRTVEIIRAGKETVTVISRRNEGRGPKSKPYKIKRYVMEALLKNAELLEGK